MTVLFYLLTPFSYLELVGVRLILFQVLLGLVIVSYRVYKKPVLHLSPSFLALYIVVAITAVYSFFSGFVDSLMAVSAFSLLMYFSFYMASSGNVKIGKIKNVYLVSCLFIALGLFFQVFVHKFFGVAMFRHQLFGGERNAYSFIWMDYSFVSLFVVSCLPIVLSLKGRVFSLFVVLLVLLASTITSARTGIAAVSLFFILLFSKGYFSTLIKGKIRPRYFMLAAVAFVIPFLFMYFLPVITGRQLTASSSGRFDDFILGFNFLLEHPLFGVLLNNDLYGSLVSTVPHNVFLFALFTGGLIYFFSFAIFLGTLARDIRYADSDILSSILICFLGFQFIPSFFSAYFFAVLLGIAIASSRLNKRGCKENE